MDTLFSRRQILLIAFGIASLIANSIVLYITFLLAYFSNGYVFSVNINTYGEAHLEFIIIPLSLVIGIYSVFSLFKQIKPKVA